MNQRLFANFVCNDKEIRRQQLIHLDRLRKIHDRAVSFFAQNILRNRSVFNNKYIRIKTRKKGVHRFENVI